MRALRDNRAVVNTAICIACAKGVVKSHDSNLQQWANFTDQTLGKVFDEANEFVKRRASTKAKVNPPDFERVKAQFLFHIETVIEMEEVPCELVINWDQTGIQYVPVSSWTMAKEGSNRVEIAGIDDKRQITAVFGATMTGDFLHKSSIRGKLKGAF